MLPRTRFPLIVQAFPAVKGMDVRSMTNMALLGSSGCFLHKFKMSWPRPPTSTKLHRLGPSYSSCQFFSSRIRLPPLRRQPTSSSRRYEEVEITSKCRILLRNFPEGLAIVCRLPWAKLAWFIFKLIDATSSRVLDELWFRRRS